MLSRADKMYNFPLKCLRDGRIALNVGCGTRMHNGWNNLDFSPYCFFARRKYLARLLRTTGILSESRWNNILKIDPDIVSWNILKGLPFTNETFDIVYSSHVIEHLDRHHAKEVLSECHRILKQNGIVRIVVPDLHIMATKYLRAYEQIESGNYRAFEDYDIVLDELFEQMVRSDAVGTSQQSKVIGIIEKLFRKGIHGRGELHKWMYDKHSLERLMRRVGFRDVSRENYDASRVAEWGTFFLDTHEDGRVYKRDSLFMEATK